MRASPQIILATAVTVAACGGPAEPPPPTLEEQAAAKCPRVHMDKMAGDWVLSTGDVKTRFRVVEQGGKTHLWYIDPAYSNHKLDLVGEKRDKDWRFDEVPRGRRKALIEAGGETRKRVYVQPSMRECVLKVFPGQVAADGAEAVPPNGKSFIQWPASADVTFSFAPHDEPVFLGEAATDWSRAQKEVEELGGPMAGHPLGEVVVAAWADAAADGDPGCAYTYDAYFDDQPVAEGAGQPAGEVADGRRPYRHTFQAPYSGNHRFEIVRFRQCGDGAREQLAVAGLDVALE